MAFRDLRDYIDRLATLGELRRIMTEVNPTLEIAEITARVAKMPEGGPALLFERVRGKDMPVATNLFGSDRRTALALGVDDSNELTGRMEAALAADSSLPWREALAGLAIEPLLTERAPCQEIVDTAPNLDLFPFLTCWPADGAPNRDGRFITLPQVFTREPTSGAANCGMYRVAIFGPDRVGIRWHPGSGGAEHCMAYSAAGRSMPVAIAVGGDPALLFAAMLPLPDSVDEIRFAGFLRRGPVEMARCVTSDLQVPAGAELVIEGVIQPGEMEMDGAFGNHTGFYVPAAKVPVVRVKAITRRRAPIYPATVVGRPPMEDCYLARAAWRLLLPLLRREVPEVLDIHLPMEWIFHGAAIIAVDRPASGTADLAARLLASPWLGRSRLLILVDAQEEIRDLSLIAWRVMNLTDWRRDLAIHDNPASPAGGERLILDATRSPQLAKSRPGELDSDAATRLMVDGRWREYGF